MSLSQVLKLQLLKSCLENTSLEITTAQHKKLQLAAAQHKKLQLAAALHKKLQLEVVIKSDNCWLKI
jgi:hypothetical protein